MTPTISPNTPEDVDQHLSRFFRSELPASFPPPPSISITLPAHTTAHGTARSGRIALAASVTLLGGVAIWASGGFEPGSATRPNVASSPPSLLKSAEASGAKLFPRTSRPPVREAN